jgi:preprotein translocase subunit YajC
MSFITNAYAETAPVATSATAAPQDSLVGFLTPFVLIFVIFYFLILRPQQKKMKQHQAMIAGVRRGDKVITSGGIVGKVAKVNAEKGTIDVEIAENVEIEVIASTLSNVVSASQPVNDNAKDQAAKQKKKEKK